jgi:hypothetical protein
MKIFSCDHCGHPVFFENVQCLHCGCALAFLPDQLDLASMMPVPDNNQGLLQRTDAEGDARTYRMCQNHYDHSACNFAVQANDNNPLCVSCRQTRLLPDLSVPANHERWARIEVAKRRLYYTLAQLGLEPRDPLQTSANSPVFQFLADQPGAQPVLTGHDNGIITLNIAEADDDERARRRLMLNEPYRTLLGHLRHESGHYYWDRLFVDSQRLADFREVFGDESQDYAQALQSHYARGQHNDWQDHYVSAYATAHPWEDWAETWAHYLHMVDLLETASAYSTRLRVPGGDTRQSAKIDNPFFGDGPPDFDVLVGQWVPVTLLVNSLNRSLGQNDAYPFALAPGAMRKLRYVHELIASLATAQAPQDQQQQQQQTLDAVPSTP